MDPILLGLTCILCAVAFYLLFIEGKSWRSSQRTDRRQGAPNRRRAANAAARRHQQQRAAAQAPRLVTESDFESLSGNSSSESSETDTDFSPTSDTPKKKIGTKKAQKLAEKKRRKEEREAEEKYREAMRKKEDEEIRKRKEAVAKEEAAEAAKAAAEEKRRLEQEAREQIEYERLKSTFSIEGEGLGVQQLDEDAEAQLNLEFIETIKNAKLISLERICVKFDMKTDACVEKIKTLISEGSLSGVLDDRGKFLSIEPSEYEAIAKFIELRGRVTMAELVEHGNKVIKARS
nr:DDRGK domain containing protein 1 [Hymenolepis microstoma]